MTTYVVDISLFGETLYVETELFCSVLGQSTSTYQVFKEVVAQILAVINSPPSVFYADIFLIPQWVSIVYVDPSPNHTAAYERYRSAVRAAAISFHTLLISSGLIPKQSPDSLFKVETVNKVTLQFSVIVNSNYV